MSFAYIFIKRNILLSFAIVAMNLSKKLVSLRSCVLLTFILLCFLLPRAKTQMDGGCSVQSMDLKQCLNQSNGSMYIKDGCCKTLNQMVQAGFNCFCSLVRASSIDIDILQLALPLSNCLIFVPSLSLCRDLASVPVMVPPGSPKEQTLLSSPPDVVVVPVPPKELYVPATNFTKDRRSSNVSRQPCVKEKDDDPKLCVLSNEIASSNTRMCLWHTLFLSFWVFLLV